MTLIQLISQSRILDDKKSESLYIYEKVNQEFLMIKRVSLYLYEKVKFEAVRTSPSPRL
jgi:hypothetical protein